jgi:hypothetical protein
MYNSHQNSPIFDPVTFDLSDYKPDGSSEGNPENIFYIPARYWDSFPLNYDKERFDYFTFEFDLSELANGERRTFKDGVFVVGSRFYDIKKSRIWNLLEKLKLKEPQKIQDGIKIYVEEADKKLLTQETFYVFKGFDGEEVVAQVYLRLPDSPVNGYLGVSIRRKYNSNMEINYSFGYREKSLLFELDKKVVTHLKSLQISPSSFARLK